MRLNFSNSDEDRINEGVRRLGKIMKNLLASG
jgi:DNA-binding transcriptional MocR family regulator